MHPVPQLADLEWLRGDRLDIVSTAEFTICFIFESAGVIQSEETVELFGKDGNNRFYNPRAREGSWLFHKIVGARVRNVARIDDWTIDITFENDLRLVMKSSDGGYESGLVTVPGRDVRSSLFF